MHRRRHFQRKKNRDPEANKKEVPTHGGSRAAPEVSWSINSKHELTIKLQGFNIKGNRSSEAQHSLVSLLESLHPILMATGFQDVATATRDASGKRTFTYKTPSEFTPSESQPRKPKRLTSESEYDFEKRVLAYHKDLNKYVYKTTTEEFDFNEKLSAQAENRASSITREIINQFSDPKDQLMLNKQWSLLTCEGGLEVNQAAAVYKWIQYLMETYLPLSPTEREGLAARYRTLKQAWTLSPRDYFLQLEYLKHVLHPSIDVETKDSTLSFKISILDHYKQFLLGINGKVKELHDLREELTRHLNEYIGLGGDPDLLVGPVIASSNDMRSTTSTTKRERLKEAERALLRRILEEEDSDDSEEALSVDGSTSATYVSTEASTIPFNYVPVTTVPTFQTTPGGDSLDINAIISSAIAPLVSQVNRLQAELTIARSKEVSLPRESSRKRLDELISRLNFSSVVQEFQDIWVELSANKSLAATKHLYDSVEDKEKERNSERANLAKARKAPDPSDGDTIYNVNGQRKSISAMTDKEANELATKLNIKCHGCNQVGHFRQKCPKFGGSSKYKAHVAESKEEEATEDEELDKLTKPNIKRNAIAHVVLPKKDPKHSYTSKTDKILRVFVNSDFLRPSAEDQVLVTKPTMVFNQGDAATKTLNDLVFGQDADLVNRVKVREQSRLALADSGATRGLVNASFDQLLSMNKKGGGTYLPVNIRKTKSSVTGIAGGKDATINVNYRADIISFVKADTDNLLMIVSKDALCCPEFAVEHIISLQDICNSKDASFTYHMEYKNNFIESINEKGNKAYLIEHEGLSYLQLQPVTPELLKIAKSALLKEKIYASAALDYDSSFEEEDEVILIDEPVEVEPVTTSDKTARSDVPRSPKIPRAVDNGKGLPVVSAVDFIRAHGHTKHGRNALESARQSGVMIKDPEVLLNKGCPDREGCVMAHKQPLRRQATTKIRSQRKHHSQLDLMGPFFSSLNRSRYAVGIYDTETRLVQLVFTKTKNEVDLQYALKQLLVILRRYNIKVKHLAVDGESSFLRSESVRRCLLDAGIDCRHIGPGDSSLLGGIEHALSDIRLGAIQLLRTAHMDTIEFLPLWTFAMQFFCDEILNWKRLSILNGRSAIGTSLNCHERKSIVLEPQFGHLSQVISRTPSKAILQSKLTDCIYLGTCPVGYPTGKVKLFYHLATGEVMRSMHYRIHSEFRSYEKDDERLDDSTVIDARGYHDEDEEEDDSYDSEESDSHSSSEFEADSVNVAVEFEKTPYLCKDGVLRTAFASKPLPKLTWSIEDSVVDDTDALRSNHDTDRSDEAVLAFLDSKVPDPSPAELCMPGVIDSNEEMDESNDEVYCGDLEEDPPDYEVRLSTDHQLLEETRLDSDRSSHGLDTFDEKVEGAYASLSNKLETVVLDPHDLEDTYTHVYGDRSHATPDLQSDPTRLPDVTVSRSKAYVSRQFYDEEEPPDYSHAIKMKELLKMEADLLEHNVVYISREASENLEELFPSSTRGKSGWLEEEIPRLHVFMMEAMKEGSIVTPKTYEEAMRGPQSKDWRKACIKEIQSLKDNKTFEVVVLPTGKNVVESRWLYKIKFKSDGTLDKFKARFVAKGYSQVFGLDYNETFAPVLSMGTMRMILAVAAAKGWKVTQLDVSTAFLYSDLEEEIYVRQPKGFHEGNKSHVWKLLKALYGLKQGPSAWNKLLTSVLKDLNLVQSKYDPCLFTHRSKDGRMVIMAVYVDDMLLTGDNVELIEKILAAMSEKFKINVMNDAKTLLGMKIDINEVTGSIKLSQEIYVERILSDFSLERNRQEIRSTPARPDTYELYVAYLVELNGRTPPKVDYDYRGAIGCLLYLSTQTRPDISNIVRWLSKFVACPNDFHVDTVQYLLGYLRGTKSYGLTYPSGGDCKLVGYSDASYCDDYLNGRSTIASLVTLNGVPVLWKSRQLSFVVLSSTHSEYAAIAECVLAVAHARDVLSEILGHHIEAVDIHNNSPDRGSTALQDFKAIAQFGMPTDIMVDNQAAIYIGMNDTSGKKAKHINVRFQLVREKICDNTVTLKYIKTQDQLADILTKCLGKIIFTKLRSEILS